MQDTSGSRTVNNSSNDNARFAVTYLPITWLTLAGNVGQVRSHSVSSSSTSNSTGLSLNASPTDKFSINASLTESANGQSTAGFYNQSATGSSSIIPTNSYGQRTRQTAFGVQYAPTSTLSSAFSVNNTLSLIPGYDNTQSNGLDWSLTSTPQWRVGRAKDERWQFTLNGSKQATTYVGGQGNSDNHSLSFSAVAGPFGRVKTDFTLARMNFGSASYYSTGTSGGINPGTRATMTNMGSTLGGTGTTQAGVNTSLSFNADYYLGGRYTLVGRWQSLDQSAPSTTSSTSSGAYRAGTNFLQGQGSIGFNVRLTELFGFRADFNYVNVHDRDDARYSYRARTLTADLTASF